MPDFKYFLKWEKGNSREARILTGGFYFVLVMEVEPGSHTC
jgi:hypothetical protein